MAGAGAGLGSEDCRLFAEKLVERWRLQMQPTVKEPGPGKARDTLGKLDATHPNSSSTCSENF